MAPAIRIDLVSDTATRPCTAMRAAMAGAPVGDEQRGEDPSVNALTERVADLLGQERALFLPSGTMCNQIALAVHCRPGDEIIAAASAHIVGSEGAGAAVFAHSVIRTIASPNGIFTGDQLRQALRPVRVKSPRSRVVAVEQTTNRGGGSVWQLDGLAGVVRVARENDLRLHMDGARLMNAVVASGVQAKDYAAPFDSVWLDLSKGLGCPIGGVLTGSAGFIEEADVWKHRLGGAMRQAGIVAAAGLYALDHNIQRLAEDHANARIFAARIAGIPGVVLLNPQVETNLVFFDISATGFGTSEIGRRLTERGIRIGIESPSVMRAVFHLDVTAAQTVEAADALARIIERAATD
jgi:threonine aldolase